MNCSPNTADCCWHNITHRQRTKPSPQPTVPPTAEYLTGEGEEDYLIGEGEETDLLVEGRDALQESPSHPTSNRPESLEFPSLPHPSPSHPLARPHLTAADDSSSHGRGSQDSLTRPPYQPGRSCDTPPESCDPHMTPNTAAKIPIVN